MENVNSTLIQKDIIIFSSYNVVVRLTFDSAPRWVFMWGFYGFAIFPFKDGVPISFQRGDNFYLQTIGEIANSGFGVGCKELNYTWNNLTLTWYSSVAAWYQFNYIRTNCYLTIF